MEAQGQRVRTGEKRSRAVIEAACVEHGEFGFLRTQIEPGGEHPSVGFAASARPVQAGALAGVQLCQGHCPVQHAAEQFPTFCEAETDAFSRLLGVHVQRLATLAGGHHVCTTFIPTAGLVRKSEDAAAVDARVHPARGAGPGDPAQRHTTTSNEPTKERSRS